MSSVVGVTGTLVYQCLPDCRCRPLPAGILVDTIGRAVLRIAPQLVDSSTGAKTPEAAASHADRVFTRITAGKNATDLHFAWCSISTAQPGQPAAEAVRHARKLADTDLFHAREVLRRTLAAVDPATADAHHGHADAANLYAEILIRLGNPAAATSWAAYAQHSFARLNGPAALRTLTAMHLRATAHRLCGHYQRAYHLYLNLSETLRISAGSDAHPALAAQANLAVVLHALGHCIRARTLLADTITLHRRAHPGHPATEKMVGHLARIWQYCADQRHQHVET